MRQLRLNLLGVLALGAPLAFAALSQREAFAQTGAAPAASVAASPAQDVSEAAVTDEEPAAAEIKVALPATEQGSGRRRRSPPPKAPSAEELRAQNAAREALTAYEESARSFRNAANELVRAHYEERRVATLAGLDESIAIEKRELQRARALAIGRLEEFVAKYTGPRAQEKATPDAMFRLAALYEERARGEDASEAVEDGLKPAIALYKRIVREYPGYPELASVYYFLGHAYNDAGRGPESQQVWRALVCHNLYPYRAEADPQAPERDRVAPLPQDHDEAYWTAWRMRNQDPARFKPNQPDGRYQEPFPAVCAPLPQPSVPKGENPKYLAEAWWQIGNYQFDLFDAAAGVVRDEPGSVYGYNRAASAYERALSYKQPPIYVVALYKYAWTLFKQQRYAEATKQFVALLEYTDEQEKATGESGADFRNEAFTYLAGSLANVDFVGPRADEPYIQRPDVLDTEPTPEMAEAKLRVGIQRVQDPAIVPQDRSWTLDVYRALGEEYRSISQYRNAVAVYDLVLQKWPMDPSAPEILSTKADVYDEMARPLRPGTPEYEQAASQALQARTGLSAYVGDTPWVQANRGNPAALKNAERLVRVGLRQAAVAHTNNGRAALNAAQETGSAGEQLALLVQAREEYRLAAVGWAGYIRQDENAPDAYESRYWHADALRSALRIGVVLNQLKPGEHPVPSAEDAQQARAAAIAVRDSNEDDKYLDNAAFFVVDVGDIERDGAYARHAASGGREGVPEQTAVEMAGEGSERKVVSKPLPPVVQASIDARDEYFEVVPPQLDPQRRTLPYRFYAAETYFLYGQFREAEARFEALYREECGKSEYGYQAWEKLITMSNLEQNAERSRLLAEAERRNSCAVSETDRASAALIVNPTLQEAAFLKARAKFEQARRAPEGPAKAKLWREAAGLYEAALEAAPGRDEAPEAAMNAAYAYKQVGDYDKAIRLYNLFIDSYGSEQRLAELEKGDPKKKVAAEPKKYAERIKFLADAYDALGATYYSFFNYTKAAETYERVAKNQRFDGQLRKDTARNAMTLYASMGDKERMTSAARTFSGLSPDAEEKVNADYLVAAFDYRQWAPSVPDSGSNRQRRLAAQESLSAFYTKYAKSRAGTKYVVEAAYRVGKLRTVAGETPTAWWKNTVAAWQLMVAAAPPAKDGSREAMASPYVDYAAEADFRQIDASIAAKYEVPAKHKYSGSVGDVLGTETAAGRKGGQYPPNSKQAQELSAELDRVIATYPSVEWVPAALARRGGLFDTLRTGLYNAVPPAIKYFDAKQEKLLQQLEDSGREDLMEKADNLRDQAREGWRTKKDQELQGADTLMVRGYASAVHLARKYNVRSAYVQQAIARLAYFTDILGDEQMAGYVTQTADPSDPSKRLTYTNGQYMQSRPGLTAVPESAGQAQVLPLSP